VTEDFRLTVELDELRRFPLDRFLEERELEQELRNQLGNRVVVSHDGPRFFLYMASEAQARAAEKVVRDVLAEHDVKGDVLPLLRWHPVEERWEDASLPLPRTEDEVEAEHRRFEEREAAESRQRGYAEWEVRVDLPSHGEARDVADRLEAEGIGPVIRRWKYLLIGAANEDEARELAERLRSEAPASASVGAEPSWAIAWEMTRGNPFATFGALGPGPGS
jgi:hypothetical protein